MWTPVMCPVGGWIRSWAGRTTSWRRRTLRRVGADQSWIRTCPSEQRTRRARAPRWGCRAKLQTPLRTASSGLLLQDCNHVGTLCRTLRDVRVRRSSQGCEVNSRCRTNSEVYLCSWNEHGSTPEESVHRPVPLYAFHLWHHDGTEDPEATQRRLLGCGSGLGAPADVRWEGGPALRVPWTHRVPGSSPPGRQHHQSGSVQLRPRGNYILRCSYFLLQLVRQPANGRQVHPLGPHPGSALGPQNRIQLPERETHAARRHRLQLLPRPQPVQLQGPGRAGVPHGADRSVCSRYSSQMHVGTNWPRREESRGFGLVPVQQLHRNLDPK